MKNQASKGLKLILWGEVLELVASVVLSMVASFVITSSDSSNVAKAVLAVITILIMLVAAIICIIGLYKANKEESSFGAALGLVCGYFIGQVIVNIIWMNDGGMSSGYKDVVTSVLDYAVTLLIFNGMLKLLANRNLSADYAKVKSSFVFYAVCMGIGVVLIVVNYIVEINASALASNTVSGVIALVLIIAYLILLIVSYVRYLMALNRTAIAVEE